MRADLGLVELDQGIEGRRVDVALLGEQRFQGAHPGLDRRQVAAVVVIVMIMRVLRVIVTHPALLTARNLHRPARRRQPGKADPAGVVTSGTLPKFPVTLGSVWHRFRILSLPTLELF
ncbi:hypothetical protein MRA01_34620 [Methylobacterium radiotolerans]|nr:hypothetical protein MRA01_34620 [Methylobacterium radiotolerans]